MANFYCKWCGSKYSSVSSLTSSSCSKNPDGKKHELYEGSEKSQYTCKCCGSKFIKFDFKFLLKKSDKETPTSIIKKSFIKGGEATFDIFKKMF